MTGAGDARRPRPRPTRPPAGRPGLHAVGRGAALRHLWRDETGSGAVLALAIVLAAVVLAVALVTAQSVHAVRTRAAVAADAAALAAADTASGRVPGEACARAAAVAAAHGASLLTCAATRSETTVVVGVGLGPISLEVTARAGLPTAPSGRPI